MGQCKQLITLSEQICSARPTEAAQRAEIWHRRPSDIQMRHCEKMGRIRDLDPEISQRMFGALSQRCCRQVGWSDF